MIQTSYSQRVPTNRIKFEVIPSKQAEVIVRKHMDFGQTHRQTDKQTNGHAKHSSSPVKCCHNKYKDMA